jgi:IS30 family transposase
MSVEPPDRAAPERKTLHLLTNAEKVQIIRLRKNAYSWTTISSILKRSPSIYRNFSEKWEQTEVFARTREHPSKILRDVEDAVSEKLDKIEDLQCERLPMRWSYLTNQYKRYGTEMGFTAPILYLFSHFSLMAKN